MTRPLPSDDQTSWDTLRRRWLTRYARIQAKTDTKIRTALTDAAEDASKRLILVGQSSTFSAGVRQAQIRLAMKELKEVHRELFDELLPIIRDGQADEAGAAVDGLTETDRRYLLAALRDSSSTKYFVESQRQAARNGVAHAISSLTKSREPLSARVYRTRSLANNWVQRLVTSSIVRGDSAQDIAKAVRAHIRPGTPGGTAYAAMRLGRTELNNAFHATSVEISKDRPWIEGMRWNLSKVHEPQGGTEACERLAGQIFAVENVPKKPHPQCRCFVTPNLIPFELFLTQLASGQYREWTENAA
ncbi:head maturation protease [Mycobacterium phage DrLupo]|uniref:MuF-like minor capsid protein n=1 Tax=Mycobacterium phage DrLupo TaxID=2499037 RepID=A0A3S9UQJ1_9CAUD|nr:head maturation protease [Mycobacterium phage DrLupo]AZS12556.1 MuF-like minor capsid protein [Mycobacterium phage DrLupo]